MQGSRQGHDFGGCQGASAQELVEGARVEGLIPEAQLIGAFISNSVELGDSGRVTQGGGYLRGLGVPLSGCIRVFLESVPVGCRPQGRCARNRRGRLGRQRNGAQGVASRMQGAHGVRRGYGGCALGGFAPVLDNLQGG